MAHPAGASAPVVFFGGNLHLLYVDEAGDDALLGDYNGDPGKDAFPFLILAGVCLAHGQISPLTTDFLHLKHRFFPNLKPDKKIVPSAARERYLDLMLAEVKGGAVRRASVAASDRGVRRQRTTFLLDSLKLLQKHDGKVVFAVAAKKPGMRLDKQAVYTSFLQRICDVFERFLQQQNSLGMVIMDHRDPKNDTITTHSLFTQKYKATGDRYPHIVEMPVYGQSLNLAGLQLADLVGSGVATALALDRFAPFFQGNGHVHPGYFGLASQIRPFLQPLLLDQHVTSYIAGSPNCLIP